MLNLRIICTCDPLRLILLGVSPYLFYSCKRALRIWKVRHISSLWVYQKSVTVRINPDIIIFEMYVIWHLWYLLVLSSHLCTFIYIAGQAAISEFIMYHYSQRLYLSFILLLNYLGRLSLFYVGGNICLLTMTYSFCVGSS